MRRAAALALAAALVSSCAALQQPETVRPVVGLELVAALREGGHVLYLRHAHTPPDATDAADPLGDCTRQRLLDAEGRSDAAALGDAVRALDVPVGEVLASPFCRTAETAELAFGRYRTEDALLSPPTDGHGPATAALRPLLETRPPEGENTVLVGHLTNLRLLSTASPEEGGTVVLRPHGDGFSLVGEVPPQGWQDLARRATPAPDSSG